MDKSSVDHFKEILSRQGSEIEHTIQLMKENKTAEQDKYSPTELSNYDNHPAEIASQLYETEHNNALKVHEEFLLKEIGEALGRIEKGGFGVCAFCGNDIGNERLEIIPYTRLCIECEETKSSVVEILNKKPPYEQEQLSVKEYLNERDDTEFEGIDYMNDLMKYGSSDTPQDYSQNRDMEDFYTNETDEQGIVDHMDRISNEQYKRQLPD